MNHKGTEDTKRGLFYYFEVLKLREEKKRDQMFKSRVSAVSARVFCLIVFSHSRHVCYKILH